MAKKATLTDNGRAAILDTETGELTITDTPYTTMARGIPFFKTPWNHDTDKESDSTALICPEGEGKTQQHLAADTDINNILAKFMQTGVDPRHGTPTYMDIDDLQELQDRMVTTWEVDQAWNQLTAEQRNILKDPLTYVRYIDHALETGDLEDLRKVGLAKPLETPPEAPKPPAPPTGGSPAPSGGTGPSGPQT